jgi:hypothetical protein
MASSAPRTPSAPFHERSLRGRAAPRHQPRRRQPEPRGFTGVYAGAGRYALHCGFQQPWLFRNGIAETTLKIPENHFRLINGDIDGSYGLRGSGLS